MQAGFTVPKYLKQGRQTSYVVDKGIGIRNFWSNDTWNRLYFLISSWCDNITWVFPNLILRVDVNTTECQVSMSTACRIFTKVTRQFENAGLFSIYLHLFLLNGCCGSDWCDVNSRNPHQLPWINTFCYILDPAASCYLYTLLASRCFKEAINWNPWLLLTEQ